MSKNAHYSDMDEETTEAEKIAYEAGLKFGRTLELCKQAHRTITALGDMLAEDCYPEKYEDQLKNLEEKEEK